jgi:hypothetical protein
VTPKKRKNQREREKRETLKKVFLFQSSHELPKSIHPPFHQKTESRSYDPTLSLKEKIEREST